MKNGVYQIGTRDGILKGWFSRTFKKSGNVLTIEDVDKSTMISVRQAAGKQSFTGGQGISKCNCKALKNQCGTRRYMCFKAGILCNFRCHHSSTCANKNDKDWQFYFFRIFYVKSMSQKFLCVLWKINLSRQALILCLNQNYEGIKRIDFLYFIEFSTCKI